jgi:hypothetical protein
MVIMVKASSAGNCKSAYSNPGKIASLAASPTFMAT